MFTKTMVKRQTTDGRNIFATNRLSEGLHPKSKNLQKIVKEKMNNLTVKWGGGGDYMKRHSTVKRTGRRVGWGMGETGAEAWTCGWRLYF